MGKDPAERLRDELQDDFNNRLILHQDIAALKVWVKVLVAVVGAEVLALLGLLIDLLQRGIGG